MKSLFIFMLSLIIMIPFSHSQNRWHNESTWEEHMVILDFQDTIENCRILLEIDGFLYSVPPVAVDGTTMTVLMNTYQRYNIIVNPYTNTRHVELSPQGEPIIDDRDIRIKAHVEGISVDRQFIAGVLVFDFHKADQMAKEKELSNNVQLE